MPPESSDLLAMLPNAAVVRIPGEDRPRLALEMSVLGELFEAATRARDQVRSYDTTRGRDAAANVLVSRVGNVLIAYEDAARSLGTPPPFNEPIQRERVLPDAAASWDRDEPDTEKLRPHLDGAPGSFMLELYNGNWNQLLLSRQMRAMYGYLGARCPEAPIPKSISAGFWLLFDQLRMLSPERLQKLGVSSDRHATATEHARLLLEWLLMDEQPSELRTCPWDA